MTFSCISCAHYISSDVQGRSGEPRSAEICGVSGSNISFARAPWDDLNGLAPEPFVHCGPDARHFKAVANV